MSDNIILKSDSYQRSSEGKMSHFDQIHEINEQLLHL